MPPGTRTQLPIRTILLPALILLALVSLPYLSAARAGGQEYVFGGFLLNPIDGNTYLAKMYQGYEGAWRASLPYTAEAGEGAYLFLFYLFLGHLARWTGLSLVAVFHLARVAGTAAMLFALYRFLTRALPSETPPGSRLPVVKGLGTAFWLAALGSGMGWLSVPFGGFTSDLWVAETYPFLSGYATPHFALGLALLLALLTLPEGGPSGTALFSRTWRQQALGAGLRALPAALLLAVLSPFGAVIAGVVLAGLLAWNWFERRSEALHPALVGRLAGIALGGGPLLVYYLWLTRSDPVLAGWNAQNLTPSPPLWDLLLSLSPALVLAVFAIPLVRRPCHSSLRLLLVWAGLGLLLLYLPWGLQRRFLMGLYVPLAALAGVGLASLGERSPRLRVLPLVVFLLAVPSNLLVLLAGSHGAQTHDPLLYLTRGEAGALEWIRANTPEEALVLAAPQTGLFIPAHTGRRVLYGHPFETVPAEAEQAQVEAFFAGEALPAGETPQAWLERRGVGYIFSGPREAQAGGIPEGIELSLAYESGDTQVYALRP